MEVDYLGRFQGYTRPGNDGCVLWTAACNKAGYGQFRCGKRNFKAHRWIWEQLVGPLEPGDTLHHKCFNRNCVNVEHLEVMTQSENSKLKKHRTCPECGHRFR